MRKIKKLGLFLATVIVLSGCASQAPSEDSVEPKPTVCVNAPELTGAISTFWAVQENPGNGKVYGEAGARLNNILDLLRKSDLAALTNPRGDGVIVSMIYAGEGVLARATARRAGWLALNEVIYPINIDASAAFGLLWDGYPDDVKIAAGLGEDYFGFDSYGIADFVAYNSDEGYLYNSFAGEANGLCESQTTWG